MSTRSVIAYLVCGILALTQGVSAEADRDQLLKGTGIYGTFAVFKVGDHWWHLDGPARSEAIAEVKQVLRRHGETVTADIHLMRGLSEQADFFLRIHSKDLIHNQNFLLDFMGSSFGKDLQNLHTFNGITKALNYVPDFPDPLKAELKTPPPQGSPYVIVVPIRKDADWWLLPHETRSALMKEHTDVTVAYLKTVKRKLYHSSGLDDLDFITYFETARLDEFNNLVTGLLKVKENRHNQRFGDPLLLGTTRPLEDTLAVFGP